MPARELHFVHRANWLRAAVLGANDGLVSTASLICGVAAAASGRNEILTAAFAGWAAGALSMAAGEYVSVSSQSDLEAADLERERLALRDEPAAERQELAKIYEARGVEPELAQRVAAQLMAKDPLAAHARDELGFSQETAANPLVAAIASAAAFSLGAVLPTVAAIFAPKDQTITVVSAATLAFLIALGALGGWLGGASLWRPAVRVGFWGAVAMAATAGIGALVGRAV